MDPEISIVAKPSQQVDSSSVAEGITDLEYIRQRLVEHDERLDNEEVLQVINRAIQAEKASKKTTRFLTLGLLTAIPLGLTAFTSTYLAIKLSDKNEDTEVMILENEDYIKKLMEQSTLSEPIASVKLSSETEEKDEFEEFVIATVDLEDVEKAWLDAQRGLQVTALSIDKNADGENNSTTRVVAVDTSDAALAVMAAGDKTYTGLSTTGVDRLEFQVKCDKDKSYCDILAGELSLHGDGRELPADCVIL